MRANLQLLAGTFILSLFLISCYPKKKILGHYPAGKLQAVRHYKHNDTLNERFVYYYDNGQKQYVRHWKGDRWSVYKMKTWYKSGALRMKGSMLEKDTTSKYNPADSSILFTGFFKVTYKEWYENGKLKFETANKNGLLFYKYYNEQGFLTKQEFICGVSPDGFDTISEKIVFEGKGRKYAKELVSHANSSPGLLLRGDD